MSQSYIMLLAPVCVVIVVVVCVFATSDYQYQSSCNSNKLQPILRAKAVPTNETSNKQ